MSYGEVFDKVFKDFKDTIERLSQAHKKEHWCLHIAVVVLISIHFQKVFGRRSVVFEEGKTNSSEG